MKDIVESLLGFVILVIMWGLGAVFSALPIILAFLAIRWMVS